MFVYKNLEEIIFKINNLDKIPIIAHPERYSYVQNNIEIVNNLHKRGVLFQSNYGSILGLYGEGAKKTIEKLLKNDCIDFIASDVHTKFYLHISKRKQKENKKDSWYSKVE